MKEDVFNYQAAVKYCSLGVIEAASSVSEYLWAYSFGPAIITGLLVGYFFGLKRQKR